MNDRNTSGMEPEFLWFGDLLSALPAETTAIAEMWGVPTKTWHAILSEASAFDLTGEGLKETPLSTDAQLGMLMRGHGKRSEDTSSAFRGPVIAPVSA